MSESVSSYGRPIVCFSDVLADWPAFVDNEVVFKANNAAYFIYLQNVQGTARLAVCRIMMSRVTNSAVTLATDAQLPERVKVSLDLDLVRIILCTISHYQLRSPKCICKLVF